MSSLWSGMTLSIITSGPASAKVAMMSSRIVSMSRVFRSSLAVVKSQASWRRSGATPASSRGPKTSPW